MEQTESTPKVSTESRSSDIRRTALAAGAYLLIALACTQIRLFDHPGFEFSFVCAIAGSFIAGFLTIAQTGARYRASTDERPFPAMQAFGRMVLLNLALLLIPFGVILLNGLFVPLCDVQEGIAFFLLLPVVSVVFSVALGLFCTVHYRRSRRVFLFLVLVSFVYVCFIGYTTPAIDSYNFFYGYFPGVSYDELLPLDTPLVTFRILTLAVAALLVWLTHLLVLHTSPSHGGIRKGFKLLWVLWRHHSVVALLVLVAAGGLYWFRCNLGWESTSPFIQEQLGSVRETEHFIIYFDSSACSGEEARRLAAEHEFQLGYLLQAFSLQHVEKIASYVYPDTETKRRLIGAGITEFAKPWNRQIHITLQGVESSLRHELAHVVAAPFGVPLIQTSLSPGLIEGLAVAVEGTWGYRTLPQYAAALHRAELAPDIQQLMSIRGFAAQSSAISYVLAGALSGYLIDHYGIRPFLQVYRNGDYETAYGKPLPALISEWKGSLDSVAVDDQTRAAVDVFFRRPTVFTKVCVRLHARRVRQARQLFAERRYAEAGDLYRTLVASGGGYDASSGLLQTLLRQQAYIQATDFYDSLVAHDPHPLRYLPLAITAGDAAWALGNPIRARSLYSQVRLADVTPGLTESATLRLWALDDTMHSGFFRTYFLSDTSDTARAGMLGYTLGGNADTLRHYLRAQVFMRMKRYNEAAILAKQAGSLSFDPLLEARRGIFIGDMEVRLGAYQDARAHFWMSLNYDAREYAVRSIDERIARCEFLERWQ
ncbi:MAG: hypothetical protein H6Q31_611 [Bacteroidetes bacterium]|nr:hypothetical protein [Bacteroidota bacterium]